MRSPSRGQPSLRYDRLVFALGSELVRPPIPGLAEHAFDIDTYDAAERLGAIWRRRRRGRPRPAGSPRWWWAAA